jgi:DNA invertase Pin-like site-specific DNA recombinase
MRGNPQRYAVGLFRVSTAEQGNSGRGLGAQQASVQAADMTGAHDLMMRIYAAMAQKEQELISERTKAALAAARARGLGGDRCYPARRWL